MVTSATCRVCGQAFTYGGRLGQPAVCARHREEWRRRVAERLDACRPWQDADATANALLDVLPGAAWGQALLTADAMRSLPATLDGPTVAAIVGELYREVAAGGDEPATAADRKRSATARELIRFGVPFGTAYRKAREGMRPDEAVLYAMRRIARLLETDRRMRGGAERATARKGAARRFPRPQA